MQARFGGFCSAGQDRIAVGQAIVKHGRGWAHQACATLHGEKPSGTEAYDGEDVPGGAAEDAYHRRQEAEYQAGLAAGRRRSGERAIYGDAFMEQVDLMEEAAAYNRGEDG